MTAIAAREKNTEIIEAFDEYMSNEVNDIKPIEAIVESILEKKTLDANDDVFAAIPKVEKKRGRPKKDPTTKPAQQ